MTVRLSGRRLVALAALAAVLAAAVVIAGGLVRRKSAVPEIQTASVELRDIEVTIEATGTVEPIDLVEVKSKASGQIVKMPVSAGSVVNAGDLLAQVDIVDVRNQYEQAEAADAAARANLEVAEAQRRRSDELFREQVITAAEHESAVLGLANAQSQAVRARTDLDVARQRLEDATVRAPISGTILGQSVAVGQVISSATSSVSGGTTLLKMADLGRIRMRALVSETDIGRVTPGQTAAVTVEAFPDRPFHGTVEKIEPQAVVQQSVTMFPVLIAITNEEGLLLPGMNGEVSMVVERRRNVTAVPLDAVRSVRELPVAAVALGLDPATTQERLAKQRAPAGGPGAGERAAPTGANTGAAAGAPAGRGRGAAGDGRGRGGFAGAIRGEGDAAGDGRGRGGFGADARAAGTMPAAQVAFVKTANGLEPRLVRIGISDFDYAQVLSGLQPGEEVALLNVAEAQAERQERQSQIRERMGSGIPGSQGTSRRGTGSGGR